MDSNDTPTGAPALADPAAREPGRTGSLGAIQPHGCLISCALPSWAVQAVSANAGDFLGREVGSMLGATLDALLPGQTLHDLRNVLQASMVSGGAERLLDRPIDDGPERYDLTVHMAASNAVVEIVPRRGTETLATDPITLVKSMVSRLKRAPTLERFLGLAANQVRAVTGFDRVVVHKILPDGSSEVKAEARRSGLTPSLGLRSPASHLPAETCTNLRRQSLQLVPDVAGEPVPLLAHSATGMALDLGLATLRGVTPTEADRLREMGSAATLTISLMAGDALWGLIACHHGAPRRIASSTCAALELFGQIFSLQIEAKEQAADLALAAGLHDAHDRLMDAMSREASIFDAPDRFRDLVAAMIPCDGYGVWTEGRFLGVGATPPAEALPDLLRHLGERDPRRPYATEALSRELVSAGAYEVEVSGVLSIPFGRGPRDHLLFFRREAIRTVTWAADTTASAEAPPIGPPGSHEARRETVRGHASPWRPAEIRIAATLRVSLLEWLLDRVDDARLSATMETTA